MNEDSRREVDLMIQRNRLAREQRKAHAAPDASSLLVPKDGASPSQDSHADKDHARASSTGAPPPSHAAKDWFHPAPSRSREPSGTPSPARPTRAVTTTHATPARAPATTAAPSKRARANRNAVKVVAVLAACAVAFVAYRFIDSTFGPPATGDSAYDVIRSSMLAAPRIVKKPWTAPTHVPTHGPLEPFPYHQAASPAALPPPPAGIAPSSSSARLAPSPIRGMGAAPATIGPGVVTPPRSVAESATAVRPYSARGNTVPVVARPGAQRLASVVLHRTGAARAAAQVAAAEAAERARLAAAAVAAARLPAPVAVHGVKVGVAAPAAAGVKVAAIPRAPLPALHARIVRARMTRAPQRQVAKAAPSAPANSFVVYHEAASPPRAPVRVAAAAEAPAAASAPASSPFGQPVRVAVAPSPKPAQALPQRVVRVADAAAQAPLQVIAFPTSHLVLIGSKRNGAMTVSPYRVGDSLPDGSRIVRVDPGQGLVFTNEGTLRVVH